MAYKSTTTIFVDKLKKMTTELITNLSEKLKDKLINADEIWIAVALINLDGLNFILDNTRKTCKHNFIIGIDLPTDPKALKVLNELQLKTNLDVSIYSDSNNYHPKLYLLSKDNDYSAFVGSANCTNGGLKNNIELTTLIHDNNLCAELLEWFNDIKLRSKPLTTEFVIEYKKDFEQRQERSKQEKIWVQKEKKKLNSEHEAIIKEKTKFLQVLKNYRKGYDYNETVAIREKNVQDLRKYLDYPKFENIDLDAYYAEWELGHLIPIQKPSIKRNIEKLKTLLKYITNENIDISIRYEKAINGNIKVDGISKAFISKVLTIHKPELYYVKNGKTEKALQKYGIKFPRGLSEGEKYKITNNFLQKVCLETGIKDLTVLDFYLYTEANIE